VEVPILAGERLCVEERELIDHRLRQGWSFTDIATELGRSPSTVSREVNANGGRDGYVAGRAQRAASERARRPKHPVRPLTPSWPGWCSTGSKPVGGRRRLPHGSPAPATRSAARRHLRRRRSVARHVTLRSNGRSLTPAAVLAVSFVALHTCPRKRTGSVRWG